MHILCIFKLLCPSFAVPDSPPSEVEIGPYNVTSASFLVSWCPPPVETTNGPITAYILEYGESSGEAPPRTISLSGVVEEHTVTGLESHTEYYVKVAAETAAGRGPFCEPVQMQTAPDSEYFRLYAAVLYWQQCTEWTSSHCYMYTGYLASFLSQNQLQLQRMCRWKHQKTSRPSLSPGPLSRSSTTTVTASQAITSATQQAARIAKGEKLRCCQMKQAALWTSWTEEWPMLSVWPLPMTSGWDHTAFLQLPLLEVSCTEVTFVSIHMYIYGHNSFHIHTYGTRHKYLTQTRQIPRNSVVDSSELPHSEPQNRPHISVLSAVHPQSD